MGVITGGTILSGTGLGDPLLAPDAPVAAVDEVWTLTVGGTPTAGDSSSFKLKAGGVLSGAILWSATNTTLVANIQAALDAMPTVGTNNSTAAVGTMTSGVGTITITAAGNRADQPLPTGFFAVGANNLTGSSPTVAIARTTAGVEPSGRNAPTGAQLIDTKAGVVYVNTSTTLGAPTWTKVGTQS